MTKSLSAAPSVVSLSREGAGPVLLVLAVLAAGFLFQSGVVALLEAWSTPEYTHGPIIPLLSAYLFAHQLKEYPPQPGPVSDRWPGVAVVGLSLLFAVAGIWTGVGDVVAYGLIVWIAGVILTSFGWARGRHFWPAVVHLVFMLPLPGFVHYAVTSELQLFSSWLGVEMIRAMGVPVLLDGNIIDLGEFKLAVAEACSGLRYLFPIMSFSYVFATLYKGPGWHKAVLLLSAAPITVMMNTVRIAIIGVMVDRFGISHAEGLSHFLEGWVIFIACVLILFALAWGMLKLQRSDMSLGEAMDMDLTGLGPQAARLRLVRPSAALAAVLAVTGLTGGFLAAAPERQMVMPEREPFALFPREIGPWRGGMPEVLEPAVARSLGAYDYHLSDFVSPEEAASVNLLAVYYEDQRDGSFHSPEVCIPAGGWEIARIETVDVSDVAGTGGSFTVNRAVIQKGVSRQLVYFWYDASGVRTASALEVQTWMTWQRITEGRPDGALVRLITPILAGEAEAEAEARLQGMLREAAGVMGRFVPE
jgi:exosortase D (VPLPA-CTERM-specific)